MAGRIAKIICGVALVLMIGSIKAECPTVFTNYSPPSWVKLQVLSVRAMSSEEYSKKPPTDVIGLDIVVRLRLSCSDKSIQYYAMKYFNNLTPVGNMVNVVNDELYWLYGEREPSKKSPGTKLFKGVTECQWLTLPSNSAIEWEALDSSYSAGQCHAISIFLKHRTDTFSKEVISPTYIVPKANGT